MFEVDEIDLAPSRGKARVETPGVDARQTARRIRAGVKFFCSRVNGDVTADECVNAYHTARQHNNHNRRVPCLECAKVLTMIKKTNPATPAVASSGSNPFAGWAKFNPRDRERPSEEFAAFSSTTLSFSSAVCETMNLLEYQTVDVFLSPGKIGLVFRADTSGALKVSRDPKSRKVAKVSATGIIKRIGLDIGRIKNKRFVVKRLGDGMCCIDLEGS